MNDTDKMADLMTSMGHCLYCWRPKTEPGWHDCHEAQQAKRRLAAALTLIDETVRGGNESWGTDEERLRLNAMASQIKAGGGKLKKGWRR
jgi:hypothetical protein